MYSADAGVIVDIIESYGLGSEEITDINGGPLLLLL